MMIKAVIKYFNEVAKEDTKPKEYEPGHKWVYSYGNGEVEGDPTMKNLLGGKGVGLSEMTLYNQLINSQSIDFIQKRNVKK